MERERERERERSVRLQQRDYNTTPFYVTNKASDSRLIAKALQQILSCLNYFTSLVSTILVQF